MLTEHRSTPTLPRRSPPPAIAEARKNQWTMAVAIVDTHGDLVYFERMDDTQVGSVDVAIAKARIGGRFKRPTKAFQDALAAGGEGLRILALDGAVPVDGGLPLVSAARSSARSACPAAPARRTVRPRRRASRRSSRKFEVGSAK